MRVTLSIATLLLVVASISAQQQNPFVGRWNLRGTGPDTDKIYFLEVTQKDGQLRAIFLDRSAHATPVASIKVEGNDLVWQKGSGEGLMSEDGTPIPVQPCGPTYRAHLEGGKLIGQHTLPGECPGRGRGAAGRAGGGEGRGANAAGRGDAPAAAGQPAANAGRAAAPAPPATPPAPQTIHWVGVRQPVWPYSNANGFHTYGKPVVI